MNLPLTVSVHDIKKIFHKLQNSELFKILCDCFIQIEQVDTYGCYNVQNHQVAYIKTKNIKELKAQKDLLLELLKSFYKNFDIQEIEFYCG